MRFINSAKKMKRNLLILAAIFFLFAVSTSGAFAQNYNRISEKKIKLVKDKKLILKGEVRDSDEVVYTFKARPNQRLTVKVNGRDADCTVNVFIDFDFFPLVSDTKSWSGVLPEFNYIEIVVHSNYKVADYSLEVLLR